ncbi:hypothetical protein D9M71_165100 [compost metagenome]
MDQLPVEQHAQQHGYPARHHTMGEKAQKRGKAPRHEARRQLDHQTPVGGVLGERNANEGAPPGAGAHRPVQATQEGETGRLLDTQLLAAHALQATVDHRHPTVFTGAHLPQPLVDALVAAALPGLFGVPGIATEHLAGFPGKEIVSPLDLPSPGPGQPDHQQAQCDQGDRHLPEQRMASGQLRLPRGTARSPCPTPCAVGGAHSRWPAACGAGG